MTASEPRRVLVLAGSMAGGGSERQTVYLLRHLDRRRFSPELCLIYRRGPLLDEVPDDVPVHAYWDGREPPRWSLPGAIHRDQVRWLCELIARRRAALLYDRTYHMALLSGPATARTPAPRVSTVVAPPERELVPGRERFARLKRRLLARSYRTADAVVAVSDAVARSTERFYRLEPHSVETIRSGVDLEALDREAAGPPPPAFDASAWNVLCAGRLSVEKGQDVLLRAFARLAVPPAGAKRPQLWLAGDGPLRSLLHQLAGELGIADRVALLGHLPTAAPLVARCDLVCVPSRYEGLPNVALESRALGTPLIATDVGGTSEVAGRDGSAVLVPPDDPAALAEALRAAFEAPAPHRPSAASVARFRDAVDVRRVVQQIEARFQRVPRV